LNASTGRGFDFSKGFSFLDFFVVVWAFCEAGFRFDPTFFGNEGGFGELVPDPEGTKGSGI
jgi:hypothetical protein